MTTDLEKMTALEAHKRSQWCSETAEAIWSNCSGSLREAADWWEHECDKPTWLPPSFYPDKDVGVFCDALLAEAERWKKISEDLSDKEHAAAVASPDVERIAEHFVGYLFERYHGSLIGDNYSSP